MRLPTVVRLLGLTAVLFTFAACVNSHPDDEHFRRLLDRSEPELTRLVEMFEAQTEIRGLGRMFSIPEPGGGRQEIWNAGEEPGRWRPILEQLERTGVAVIEKSQQRPDIVLLTISQNGILADGSSKGLALVRGDPPDVVLDVLPTETRDVAAGLTYRHLRDGWYAFVSS